ncbi:hypothetical protein HID58_068234, partial [Brassica napus]
HHRICYVLLPRLRAWPPRASCLKLKTPFSEPHLPLPPCLVRQYHHLRRLVFFLCHLCATSAASSSSFFMTSSPSRLHLRHRTRGRGFTEKAAGGVAQRKLHGIEVDKKDFVVVNSGWKREKNIRVGQLEKRKKSQ